MSRMSGSRRASWVLDSPVKATVRSDPWKCLPTTIEPGKMGSGFAAAAILAARCGGAEQDFPRAFSFVFPTPLLHNARLRKRFISEVSMRCLLAFAFFASYAAAD